MKLVSGFNNKLHHIIFISIIVFFLLLLFSCKTYTPQIIDIKTKLDSTIDKNEYLSNFQYHPDSTYEYWEYKGLLNGYNDLSYTYLLRFTKLNIENQDFWIITFIFIDNQTKNKYFFEQSSYEDSSGRKI